jgi:uncharacterized protein GlcG (DUF336 family)
MNKSQAILPSWLLAALVPMANAQDAAQGTPPASRPAVSPQSIPSALSVGPPPRAQQHVARGPTMKAAWKLAKKIEAACRSVHIAVSIIDSEGMPKLFYVPDGTAGFHAYTAFRKANAALKFNMPSGHVATAIKSDPELAAVWETDAKSFNANLGGLLLMAGDNVIGAVGVSGAPTVQPQLPGYADEVCGLEGIKAVRPMLK